jgi:hypothetical protein
MTDVTDMLDYLQTYIVEHVDLYADLGIDTLAGDSEALAMVHDPSEAETVSYFDESSDGNQDVSFIARSMSGLKAIEALKSIKNLFKFNKDISIGGGFIINNVKNKTLPSYVDALDTGEKEYTFSVVINYHKE